MTVTERPTPTQPTTIGGDFRPVAVDLYRDIHKGIRAVLFDLTGTAGSVDPADGAGRSALAVRVGETIAMLDSHAEHEDRGVQPALELHLPDLAEKIADDHEAIEGRFAGLADLADAAAVATRAEQRLRVHQLYLELAAFTAVYLVHQDVEERVVGPALEAAIGVEASAEIHHAIVSSIPPDQMASSMAVMLPAMNIDDRAELLGGMQAGAPPEVFAGIWGLAGTVLTGPDHAALGARLGLA